MGAGEHPGGRLKFPIAPNQASAGEANARDRTAFFRERAQSVFGLQEGVGVEEHDIAAASGFEGKIVGAAETEVFLRFR